MRHQLCALLLTAVHRFGKRCSAVQTVLSVLLGWPLPQCMFAGDMMRSDPKPALAAAADTMYCLCPDAGTLECHRTCS
jgi:hypothetical protein